MSNVSQQALDEISLRGDWFQVSVAARADGGWDIVLRIDGAYADRNTAEGMAEFWRQRLGLTVPPQGQEPDGSHA